jgi:hypothetical protein
LCSHESASGFRILSQMNPTHNLTPHLLKIHFYTILQLTPQSLKLSCPCFLTNIRYMLLKHLMCSHALTVSFSLIIPLDLVSLTIFGEAPHYAVFSILLSLPFSHVQPTLNTLLQTQSLKLVYMLFFMV